MAITLTTSSQKIGENLSNTIGLRLYAWYSNVSGASATVHAQLQACSQGITYTGTNKNGYVYLASNSGGGTYSDTMSADTWYVIGEATATYSSGQQITTSGDFWSYVYGYTSVGAFDAVVMPTIGQAPSGLYGSNITPSTEGFSAEIGITAWNGGNGHWKALTVFTQGYSTAILSSLDSSASLVSNITATNTTHTSGSPDLQPNTYYSLRASASNYIAQANVSLGDYATLPAATTVAVDAVTPTTVTISYTTGADGGALSKTIEYSLDGGTTWQTVATVSTGTPTSGTYTITGLNNGTTYSIQTRTTTTAGSTVGTTLSATTSSGLYGSVNGQTKQVIKLYGSVNGQTKEITKLYGSVNGVTKRIF